MSLPPARRTIGSAMVFGDRPMKLGGTCDLWLAAVRERAPLPAVLRIVHPFLEEDGEILAACQRTARLRVDLHPTGITPRLFDLFQDGTSTCILEEQVGDIDLQTLLRARRQANRPLPPGFAIHLARTLAALQQSAERLAPGVRCEYDLTDLLLGWDGRIRVLAHAGPAWNERSHGAAVGIIRGQFGLLAPERVQGATFNSKSNMYAVGVLAFMALIGEHPLHADATSTLGELERTLQDDLPPPSDRRRETHPDLDAFVERCGQRRPDDRFPSWVELEDALYHLSREVEPFAEQQLAWILAEQFPEQAAAAAANAKEIAALDLAALPEIATVQLGPDSASVSVVPVREWDSAAAPDLTGAVWGQDARAAVPAGTLLMDVAPVSNAEFARFVIATRRTPPVHWGAEVPPVSTRDLAAAWVTQAAARAYAAWAGKRLPTLDEWSRSVALLGPRRLATGRVWEWTATPFRAGFVVCGGRWRDRPEEAPAPQNISHESVAAADVGFRCVADRQE